MSKMHSRNALCKEKIQRRKRANKMLSGCRSQSRSVRIFGPSRARYQTTKNSYYQRRCTYLFRPGHCAVLCVATLASRPRTPHTIHPPSSASHTESFAIISLAPFYSSLDLLWRALHDFLLAAPVAPETQIDECMRTLTYLVNVDAATAAGRKNKHRICRPQPLGTFETLARLLRITRAPQPSLLMNAHFSCRFHVFSTIPSILKGCCLRWLHTYGLRLENCRLIMQKLRVMIKI